MLNKKVCTGSPGKPDFISGKTLTILFIFALCLFDTSSLIAQSDTNSLIPFRKGDKWGFCDKDKKIIIDVKYDFVRLFCEGIALVTLNDKRGFIDTTGKEITPLKYGFNTRDFFEGFAVVELNNKYGLIELYTFFYFIG